MLRLVKDYFADVISCSYYVDSNGKKQGEQKNYYRGVHTTSDFYKNGGKYREVSYGEYGSYSVIYYRKGELYGTDTSYNSKGKIVKRVYYFYSIPVSKSVFIRLHHDFELRKSYLIRLVHRDRRTITCNGKLCIHCRY